MQDRTKRTLSSWSIIGVSAFCTLAWLLLILEDLVEGRNYAVYLAGAIFAAIVIPTAAFIRRRSIGDRTGLAILLSVIATLAGAWVAVLVIWPGILAWPRDKTRLACEGNDPVAAIAACTALLERPNGRAAERRHAYRDRGLVYEKQRDYTRALADYDAALGIDPRNATLLNDRGVVRMKMGDLDGAIADYDASLGIARRFGLAFANRGIARKRKGDLDGAIADYTRAIEINPKNPHPRFNRAVAFEAKGDLDAARTDVLAYRALQPDAADGLAALTRVEDAIARRDRAPPSNAAREREPPQ